MKPIGKIIYYAIRIEFQMRDSPHAHCLLWTSDCPQLTEDNIQDYIDFIDQHVSDELPDISYDPELYRLVNFYQRHSHSRTCCKYKNVECRFDFGKFFSAKTIVSKPVSSDFSASRRCDILSKVKIKVNEVLDPHKDNYKGSDWSIQKMLDELNISSEDYYNALQTSADNDFHLNLKRSPNSCFINNYFVAGLKGWKANVDLQRVFNYHKCISYICSYFSKDENESSEAIRNAAKEAKENNLDVKSSLKKLGAGFLSSREVSVQDACQDSGLQRGTLAQSLLILTCLTKD